MWFRDFSCVTFGLLAKVDGVYCYERIGLIFKKLLLEHCWKTPFQWPQTSIPNFIRFLFVNTDSSSELCKEKTLMCSNSNAGGGQAPRRFIDLSTDIGFKIAFGNPDHPALAKGLLQALIPDRKIDKLEFLNTETLPEDVDDKRMNFDVRCTDEKGDSFVCEMQKVKYGYFPDRLMAYSGDPLKRLLRRGQSYATIKPLYMVCILDHYLDDDVLTLVRTAHVTMDDNRKILSDKLNFLFLQLPAAKGFEDGNVFLEKLAYSIRHMSGFEELPKELSRDRYFAELAEVSDRAFIREEQLKLYDYMIRDEVQIQAERDYAVEMASKAAFAQGAAEGKAEGIAEGIAEGKVEGKAEVARAMKAADVPVEEIVKFTGLSEEAVASLDLA